MNQNNHLVKIDTSELTTGIEPTYLRQTLTSVNDHVVQLSVCYEPYFWHRHPNSDETFLVLEGEILIELESQAVRLLPGQLFTIPKDTPHKTSPISERTVNLTFEGSTIETVKVDH